MRRRLLGSVTALLAGAGAALAQAPTAPPPASPKTPPPPAAPAPPPAGPAAGAAPLALPTPLAPSACAPCEGAVGERLKEAPVTLPGRVYGSAEYLLWFSKGQNLPPIVTRGPVGDPLATGIPGVPGTTILFGNEDIDGDARSGVRARAGLWLNACQTVGFEVSGFYLSSIGSDFATSATDNATILARPFSNADVFFQPGSGSFQQISPNTALLLSLPGEYVGAVTARTTTQVWGADALGRLNVAGSSRYRADLLAGFRYLRLAEELEVNSTSTAVGSGAVPFRGVRHFTPASVSIQDVFKTRNEFYGGHVAGLVEFQRGIWYADLRAGLGIGVNHGTVQIDGSTTLNAAGAQQTAVGGLFAQSTNIGRFANDEFAIIPEASLTIGCQITPAVRAYAGYSILYWRNSVLRPGTEIDQRVNSTLIPASLAYGPSGQERNPAPLLREVDFWVQGLHVGVEIGF